MQYKRHRIQFPQLEAHDLEQDEVYFYVVDADNERHKIRFHDYDEIYKIPGLYEQVFYDRLKCCSPAKVTSILKSAVDQTHENFTELRVLDLGAGNGLMGESLKIHGVSRLVGVDIIAEARIALERDRPHLYDAYYVSDFCNLTNDEREEFKSWSLNCLTTVAALGFGDIPPKAFMEAFNIIQPQGWIAFNIKNTFLDDSDSTGFSRMIRDLMFSEYLDVYHMERYKHRLSMEGEPLYYFAIAGRKNADIPKEYFKKYVE
ncbi:MAG: methyltransferase [Gammaproteobacteria bacterium]|nr:methyltransferase [Gammaproteobacteria bacterium]